MLYENDRSGTMTNSPCVCSRQTAPVPRTCSPLPLNAPPWWTLFQSTTIHCSGGADGWCGWLSWSCAKYHHHSQTIWPRKRCRDRRLTRDGKRQRFWLNFATPSWVCCTYTKDKNGSSLYLKQRWVLFWTELQNRILDFYKTLLQPYQRTQNLGNRSIYLESLVYYESLLK